MEEEFVPYSLALELKELGFNEICLTYYNFDGKIERSDDWDFGVDMENKRDRNQCLAPLWQQVFRFFREQLLLDSCIIPYWFIDGEYKVKKYTYSIEPSNRFDEYFDCDSDEYDTYKDAELECLRKLIELAKEQNVK